MSSVEVLPILHMFVGEGREGGEEGRRGGVRRKDGGGRRGVAWVWVGGEESDEEKMEEGGAERGKGERGRKEYEAVGNQLCRILYWWQYYVELCLLL